MWKVNPYNASSVNLWKNNYLSNNIFRIHPEALIHTAPAQIEVTSKSYRATSTCFGDSSAVYR